MDQLGYIQPAHKMLESRLVPAEPAEIRTIHGWLKDLKEILDLPQSI